jgi:hypothetical protein
MQAWFARIAGRVADWAGSSWAFCLAVLVILVWAVTGPLFGFSDTWQLVIKAGDMAWQPVRYQSSERS